MVGRQRRGGAWGSAGRKHDLGDPSLLLMQFWCTRMEEHRGGFEDQQDHNRNITVEHQDRGCWRGDHGRLAALQLDIEARLKSLYMCRTLHMWDTLISDKEWYLSKWDISAIGATTIAKAIKTNTTLKVLNMYGNKIGDAGAAALADAFASTTSLKRLYLCACGIEMQGVLALGRAWGTNLALSLDLDLIGEFDDNRPLIQQEAGRVRALALLRREKLVAFGMAMIKRLGGGQGEEEGSTRSSREASVFYYMCKDVFRLIGEAYPY